MTPSLAYLIDWWVFSNLWNGVSTPQKQIFTCFSSSLDLRGWDSKSLLTPGILSFQSSGYWAFKHILKSIHSHVWDLICKWWCWEVAHQRLWDTEAQIQLGGPNLSSWWRTRTSAGSSGCSSSASFKLSSGWQEPPVTGYELQRTGDLWHQPGDLTLRDTAGANKPTGRPQSLAYLRQGYKSPRESFIQAPLLSTSCYSAVAPWLNYFKDPEA